MANNDVIDDLEYDAMEQYQEENAKLFDLVYDSINFSSEWEILDAEHVRTSFIKGAVRDSASFLKTHSHRASTAINFCAKSACHKSCTATVLTHCCHWKTSARPCPQCAR